MGTMFEVVYRKKKGLYKWKPPEETSEVGQLEGALTGEPLVDGSGQVAQGWEGPGTPSGVEGQVARLGSLGCGTSVRVVGWVARGWEGPSAPSGTKGQVAMLGSLGVLDKCAKWLVAKGSPAGSPRQARRFECAGSGPVGKVGWGLVGETPTFLHSDLTWRANPAVSAQ